MIPYIFIQPRGTASKMSLAGTTVNSHTCTGFWNDDLNICLCWQSGLSSPAVCTDCALGKNQAPMWCLVTQDVHGCCHGNLQPISIDLSMESLRRTGWGPKGLELPEAYPPADSLPGNLGDTGQCPGKQVRSVARCKILLSLLPKTVCIQVAKLFLWKRLFFKPSSPSHIHTHTKITFSFKKKKKREIPKLNSHHLMQWISKELPFY